MPTNAMKTPLVRVASRGLAAQAAAKPKGQASGSSAPSVAVLSNKVTVAAQENCGALSRLSIIFRAGARNETAANRGAAAAIRAYAGLGTEKFTQFGIIRNIQQGGGSLSVTGDRETTAFTLVATRDEIEDLLPYLAQVACSPAFKPWELKDNLPLLKYQMALLTPQIRSVDILHKAAFRQGLGNSIFLKKDHLGKHDGETLKHFLSQNFTANRAAVAAVNLDSHIITDFAQALPLASGGASESPSSYKGGEIRKDKYGNSAQIAIATEGASLKNQKEVLAFAVLQNALGGAPSVPWGIGASPLLKKVAGSTNDRASALALNVSYTDTGLFGVLVSSSAKAAGQAVEAAVSVLRSGSVSDADVARGKAVLIGQVLNSLESTGRLVEDIATQTLLTGNATSGSDLVQAIQAVSTSDVSAAAKKVASGKLSLGGFGNLTNVPYLDQLK